MRQSGRPAIGVRYYFNRLQLGDVCFWHKADIAPFQYTPLNRFDVLSRASGRQ